MNDVDGIVDVERNGARRRGVARAVDVDQRAGQAADLTRRRRILPARHGRLAGETDRSVRQLAQRQFETRIVAQSIEIVGVLVAAGDRQHAGAQNVGDTVDHSTLIARISDAGGEPICDLQTPFGLRKQQHTAVRRQTTAIERGGNFPATNGWEGEGESAIVSHGGRGTFCLEQRDGVSTRSLFQIRDLDHDRHHQVGLPVNIPG